MSDDLWRDRLGKPAAGVYSLVAEIDTQVVGHLGFSVLPSPRRNHTATVGMAVLDSFANKGVGSALLKAAIDLADNWLNLSRIELTVFTDNIGYMHPRGKPDA